MIYLKTKEEIDIIRKANILVSKTLAEVGRHIKPGVTTLELDVVAEEYIKDNGAIPGFKGYGGFPSTLCTSINEVVVHGLPSNQELKEGDIISIDCGTIIDGYYGDSAYTFCVGEVSPKKQQLLQITKEALYKGIEAIKKGSRVGDISWAIQQHAERHNMSVVREMVGHGIGKQMHEEPQIPNYGKAGNGTKLKTGMVICIEPMINLGTKDIVFQKDGWTITTKDKKPSAHFELCVALYNDDVDVLSTFKYIEN